MQHLQKERNLELAMDKSKIAMNTEHQIIFHNNQNDMHIRDLNLRNEQLSSENLDLKM
jgi:hypothetical protein